MIGSTIRSAKMNAITPPKLMPPDQRTAASGTLPTEQTKLRTAMSGPDDHVLDGRHRPGGVGQEERVEEVVAERGDEPGQQEAEGDLLPQHLPVAAEVVGDVRPGRCARDPLAQINLLAGRVVLMARVGLLRVLAGLLLEPGRDEAAKKERHERRSSRGRRRIRPARTASRSAPTGRARAPTRGSSTRTGRRAPTRRRRPSGRSTCRSRPRRRSTTRTRRRGRGLHERAGAVT